MRRILHMDMDAFFAAVEEKRHPELRGRPIVVGGGGDPTKRGVVSTANYEARKFGIHSAMPLKTAYKLCPQAVFLPVDYEEYSRISGIIKSVLREFSPVMEDVGIDEAFLDISNSEMSSEEISREIKRRVLEETGLTCSIGIAPNKLLAKIGSDMEKPDGLTIITEGDVESRIWPLAVRKLWGVGPKTEEHLKAMGIDTSGGLASLPLDTLIAEFGRSFGAYLYEASRGIDDSPLVTRWEPKSASRETTFQRDTMDKRIIEGTLLELLREALDDLRQRGYRGRSVTVKLRFRDFQTLTRAKTLPALTDSFDELKGAALQCLERFEFRKPVRLIGVRIGDLEKSSQE